MQNEGISDSGYTSQTYCIAFLYIKGECTEHMDLIIGRFNDFKKNQLITV